MNREELSRAVADPTAAGGGATTEPTDDGALIEVVLRNGTVFHIAAPPSPIYAGTMTEAEAARLLGLPLRQIVELRLAGNGPRKMRHGRAYRYRLIDLEDYAESLVSSAATRRRRHHHLRARRERASVPLD